MKEKIIRTDHRSFLEDVNKLIHNKESAITIITDDARKLFSKPDDFYLYLLNAGLQYENYFIHEGEVTTKIYKSSRKL